MPFSFLKTSIKTFPWLSYYKIPIKKESIKTFIEMQNFSSKKKSNLRAHASVVVMRDKEENLENQRLNNIRYFY